MAKSVKNKRCPLQEQCERKCTHEGNELNCDYYNVNGIGDFVIEDQEAIRSRLEKQKEDANYEAELAEELDEEDVEDDGIGDIAQHLKEKYSLPQGEPERGKITYIKNDELYPHPSNPRKDLGDLTELADSIKVKGVLQNLTVVKGRAMTAAEWLELEKQYKKSPSEDIRCRMNRRKCDDGYTIIIGHRRAAAAKLAGITELPCVVVEMSPQDQIATMLLENIQRADLTFYEQAHGFQMMLYFGDTVETVSEKTGFSQSTVRRRIKLMELDQTKLKKASERQITMFDFDRLNKVEDIMVRNKILDAIGTSNFEYEIKTALDNQAKEENKKRWRKALSEFAIELEKSNNSKEQVKYILLSDSVDKVEMPTDTADTQYYFSINDWGGAYLYKDRAVDDETTRKQSEENERRRKVDEAKSRLREICARMYALRSEFVKSYGNPKKVVKEIIDFLVHIKLLDRYSDWEVGAFIEWMHGDFDEPIDTEEAYQLIAPDISAAPEKALLYAAYLESDDDNREECFNWNGMYERNDKLSVIYDFLVSIGYKMSYEEKAIMDGTHELYIKPALPKAEENDEEDNEDIEEELDADEE